MSNPEKPNDVQDDVAKLRAEINKLDDSGVQLNDPGEKVKPEFLVMKGDPTEKAECCGPNKWEQQEAERKKCAREDRVLMNELRATEITRNKLLLDIWADEVEMKKESHQAYLKDVKSLIQWRAENTRILNSVALAAQGFVKVVGLLASAGEKVAKRWSK